MGRRGLRRRRASHLWSRSLRQRRRRGNCRSNRASPWPRRILAVDWPSLSPALRRHCEDGLDDLGGTDRQALGLERGHFLVRDPTRHDVVKHGKVSADVESETVHGAPAAVTGADGANLARSWAVQAGPDAWVALEPPRVVEAEAVQCVDDELFDLVDVTRGCRVPARHGKDRVADHLAGAVVGDIAAPVDPEQLCANTGRVDQHVLGPCADTGRVHVGVLEQQEPVVSGLAGRPQSTLQDVSVAVGNPRPEPAQAQRSAGG